MSDTDLVNRCCLVPLFQQMARAPRLVVPGIPAHIVQRGNNRQSCFCVEQDYLVYLALLQEASRESGCAVHAYCLMTNHVHLLVTPREEGACSRLMKSLGQRYAYYFNRKHRRTGSLWEGRYRSSIVESSRYVVACYRYIERNPVRARIVPHPAQYAWSSYAANALGKRDGIVEPHEELLSIGRQAYAAMVLEDEPLLQAIREATAGGYPLATEPYKATLESAGKKVAPIRPGPKPSRREQGSSVSDTDLFSGGGVS